MTYKNLPHQDRADDYIKNLPFFALFMQQGTGKSRVVLNHITRLYRQGLIDKVNGIMPPAIMDQWSKEVLQDHCEVEYVVIVWDGFSSQKKQREYQEFLRSKKLKFFFVNYEAFQTESKKIIPFLRQFFSTKKAFVFCDESTKISNYNAKRTQEIIKLYANIPFKAILTGTPTKKGCIDLFSQFEFLKPGFWGLNLFQFKARYCITIDILDYLNKKRKIPLTKKWYFVIKAAIKKIRENTPVELQDMELESAAVKYGIKYSDLLYIEKMEKFSANKNEAQLKEFIKPYTFFCSKDEALDLPPKVKVRLTYELTAEQRRVIKELKANWMTEYQGKELTSENTLAILGRLQMVCSGIYPYDEHYINNKGEQAKRYNITYFDKNPKLDLLLDDIDTTLEENESAIIWANFTAEIEQIYKEISKIGTAAKYYGKTSKADRAEIESAFKAGEIQFLVINPSVGEFGLNFQMHRMNYFYSNTYQAERRDQAEDRTHRIRMLRQAIYKDFIGKNTIEELIFEVISGRVDLMDYFRTRPLDEIIF